MTLFQLRSDNVEKQRISETIEVKQLVINCYSSRTQKPRRVLLNFKIFKNGPLSSYGTIDDAKGKDLPFFKVLEPKSSSSEIDCVRNIVRKVEYKLSDYRMSEDIVEVSLKF